MSNTKGRTDSAEYKRNRLLVLARDEYICRYCGNEATTVDHVVPWILSRDDSMDNLVACCLKDNLAKGAGQWVRLPYWNTDYLDHL